MGRSAEFQFGSWDRLNRAAPNRNSALRRRPLLSHYAVSAHLGLRVRTKRTGGIGPVSSPGDRQEDDGKRCQKQPGQRPPTRRRRRPLTGPPAGRAPEPTAPADACGRRVPGGDEALEGATEDGIVGVLDDGRRLAAHRQPVAGALRRAGRTATLTATVPKPGGCQPGH